MQKKHYSLMLMFALMLGTLMTVLPSVKAEDSVRFYVDPLIYPGVAPPPPFPPPPPNLEVAVMIESPYSWMGTADGIIGFMVSVRVDPRALKVVDIVPGAYGEDFLDMYAVYLQYYGYDVSTVQGPPAKDTASGTIYGYANGLTGPDWDPALGGAGGDAFNADDVCVLCVVEFVTVSETLPSLIDLMGPGVSPEQIVKGIEVSCKYTTAAGDTVVVEPEDGYYVDVVDTMYLDSLDVYDPASPIGSVWHELAPVHCRDWTMDSWEDNGDGVLSESDQVDMTCIDTGYYGWFHVEWVNPSPVPGDGIADLIVKFKEPVPEFPLGAAVEAGLIVAVAYIWWTRRRRLKQVL